MSESRTVATKKLSKNCFALILIAGAYVFLDAKDVSWLDAATLILLLCLAEWQLETQTKIDTSTTVMTEHLEAVEERLKSIDNTIAHLEKTLANRQS